MAFFPEEKETKWDFYKALSDALIGNFEEGVVIYEPDFKIIKVNKAAADIFEIDSEEVEGRVFSLAEAKNAKSKIMAQAMFASLAPTVVRRSEPGADPQILDISLEDPIKELTITTIRVSDKGGQTAGFVKIIKDRTRELELLRSKSEFVTVAAHQLRTPATAINWALDSLSKEKDLTEAAKGNLGIARKTAHNLLEIINDLISASQIEEGKFGYNFKELDLVSFLEKILADVEPVAAEYKVKVYFERPKAKNLIVSADPARLGMAISNLIDNAVKYNVANGQVVVALNKSGLKLVEVSIKDTGVGISARDLPKIFNKFFRGKGADKIAVDGSGLGLYLAKNIITRHGGKIWAESVPERGSTFYFTLPLK